MAYKQRAGAEISEINDHAIDLCETMADGGAVLRTVPRELGGRPAKNSGMNAPVSEATEYQQVIDSTGFSRRQAQRWQDIARVPIHRWRKRLKAIKEAKGVPLSFQSCANAGWVSRQLETSRRREVLRWSHHAEVAALDPADQRQRTDVTRYMAISNRPPYFHGGVPIHDETDHGPRAAHPS